MDPVVLRRGRGDDRLGGSGDAAENALQRSQIAAQDPPWDKGARKFMFVAQAAALLILSCWPDLSLWRPRFMK